MTFISLAKPARREELLAGQPPRVRTSEEDRDGSNVNRLPGAAQRGLRGRVLLPVGADEAPGARALGVDHARVDGVDPDLLRPQLAGEDARNPVDGGLGAGVHRAVRRRDAADRRADVDDAAAFAQVLRGRLRGEEQAQYVDVEQPVKRLLSDGGERRELVDAGVVHQDVELSKDFDGGVDDALRALGPGDVAGDGHGLASRGLDGGDHFVGAGLAGGVVDTTDAPSAASDLAMPAPMPFDAPVTTATLPASLPMGVFLSDG